MRSCIHHGFWKSSRDEVEGAGGVEACLTQTRPDRQWQRYRGGETKSDNNWHKNLRHCFSHQTSIHGVNGTWIA